ncbi:hypothetical protein [[Mycobacterium] wendilense]|uniref:LGFP repeat-containing protein n=1 Tax=[Mycobacterium] wendilense TaxID=3064284 RepID=A0ABN9NYP6_9MYCO|nr:hypothetical protein [Mycolicibacterium sp. MU0050]CAJ1579662.1 hypothetical protein MU0050_000621 [Mycolicibacterium sp. MU0050]
MRNTTKKVAAVSALSLGFALVGAACASEDADDTAATTTTTAAEVTEETTTTTEAEATETGTTIPGADGTEYVVSGAILEKWQTLDATAQESLGAPTGEQQTNTDGGVYQQFDDGVIISSEAGSFVVWGKIRDKWNELGGSQGDLGYPTSDETTNAEGQKQTTFQNGTVTWTEGQEEAVVVEGAPAESPAQEPAPAPGQ